MPTLVFITMLAFPVGMTALAVWVALRTRTRAALMAATPTANVGFATDGYVEFEGQALAVNGLTLAAPLTGAPCVWYHAKLEQWTRSPGRDAHDWKVIHDVTSGEPFLLRDDTGLCLVFPDGAEVTCTDRSVWFGATPVPDDKQPERMGPGQSPEGNVRVYGTPGKEFRYTEERV